MANGDNSGIVVFGMLILAAGGAAFMLMRNKSSESESTPEPQINNIYNVEPTAVWIGGPRYNYWWDYGRRYYGRWFRDYDWDDYYRWLRKRHRRDDEVDRWLRSRYKVARKNRNGDRHNRDRDDDDKEWWKRAVDWDKDHDRDRDRDRNRNNNDGRRRQWNGNNNNDLVVSAAAPLTPLDDEIIIT